VVELLGERPQWPTPLSARSELPRGPARRGLIGEFGEVGSQINKPTLHQLEHLLSQLGRLTCFPKVRDRLPVGSYQLLLLLNTVAGGFQARFEGSIPMLATR
jgi:hypothetical protein